MKFKSSFVLLFLFVIVAFSSTAQYKYDIGLRVSSYDLGTFQFDARYHLKKPYTVLLRVAGGSETNSQSIRTQPNQDSLVYYSNNFMKRSNYSVQMGAQRKLSFFETDVFYFGATLGIGYRKTFGQYSYGSYVLDSIVFSPYPTNYTSEILSVQSNFRTRTLSTELTLSFGMDVPITKRFSINAEIGLETAFRKTLNSSSSFFDQHSFVAGGLRYSFCKKD